MTNKPAPLGGRILAAVLDLILIYILVIIAVSYMLSGKYSLYHTQIITNSKVEYKSIYHDLV